MIGKVMEEKVRETIDEIRGTSDEGRPSSIVSRLSGCIPPYMPPNSVDLHNEKTYNNACPERSRRDGPVDGLM
ncbi:MAG: hypothetical protein ACYSW0_24035, partial [Planctomycetota bacterium]